MEKFTDTSAARSALDLAKIICANPSCKIEMNKESGQRVVDFIQTVSDKLQSGNK